MKTKPHAESVIAHLMSLDEQLPQHPVHKQHRVLSQNYLHKTASICFREGSSFSVGCSCGASSGWPKGEKESSVAQIPKDQHYTLSLNDSSIQLSAKEVQKEVLKVLAQPRQRKVDIFSKKHPPGDAVSMLRKVENDSLAGHSGKLDHWNNFFKSQMEMLDRSYRSSTQISVLKSNSARGKNYPRHASCYLHPKPVYINHGEPLQVERRKLYHNSKQDAAEMIAQKDSLGPRGSNGCEKLQPSLSVDLYNNATISQNSTTRELSSFNFSRLDLNNGNPQEYSKGFQNTNEKNSKKGDRFEVIERGPIVSKPSISDVVSEFTLDGDLENAWISCRIIEHKDSDPNPGIFSVIHAHFSDAWEAFSRQEFFNEVSKEDFHKTLKGLNQYSPSTVLSLDEIENSSVSDCFESIATSSDLFESVATGFNSLFESEETHTKGSGMAISSGGVLKKESDDFSQNERILQWSFGYEESRDYSYLFDVLDGAGFDALGLSNFSKTFHSQEDPVRPFIFEALEKNYSKQTSWRKSERKLLFDRINSGLGEIIISPLISFDKYRIPIRRRFRTILERDEIEEELWQFLISQEKSQDSSKKFLGKEMKWFDLEEDVNSIITELEKFLFDELVVELFCRDDE